MYTSEDDPHTVAEEALRRVRDPEAFLKAFRQAHVEEQLRRRQFVEELSPDVKAEWIDGEAVYHSPAREIHNWTTHGLDVLLGIYSMFREPLLVRVEKAMIELERDNFEPDLSVWRAADHRFERDQLLYPRPDLVVEVLSPKTRARDLGKKKREYGLAGTHEYWVVDTDANTLTRYVNEGAGFSDGAQLAGRDRVFGAGDTVTSSWLPDLAFPMAAIWEDPARKAWTVALVG